jgi:hypothetical protein
MSPNGVGLPLMKFLFALIAICTFSGLANASIAVALDGSPEFNGTDYSWTYDANLGSGEGMGYGTPSFFTIYDFVGLDSVISAPTDWTYSIQLLGITPSTVSVPDNPDIENVTFYYNGPQVNGPQSLGDFVISSADGAEGTGNYAYQTGTAGGIQAPKDASSVDQGSGSLTVPTTATPEPKLGLVMALGAGLLGLAARRRKFATRTP